MVTRMWPVLVALLAADPALGSGGARAGEAFPIGPGDRVVLVGNTFIERDQTYGYLETGLTVRHPGRPIVVRNLGWSGDTVFGEARASFDPPPVGFQRLKEHVFALKPTVIFVGYGGVESFEGASGLPHFLDGLKTLLDTLAETQARLVILAPLRQENLGPPLPDPTRHNEDVRLYGEAMSKMAAERGLRFIDLDIPPVEGDPSHPARPLTDDSLHPTDYGSWRLAEVIERGLGLAPPSWRVELGVDGTPGALRGTRISGVKAGAAGLRFETADDRLPGPPPPGKLPGAWRSGRTLRVAKLPQGRYELKIDGRPVTVAESASWSEGVEMVRGPEFDQVEQLRRVTITKNRLYFYRWRPQNETYLFGFRKHEQGRNGAEIVQFDPLIAEQEAAIATLSVPVAHSYELVRNEGKEGR